MVVTFWMAQRVSSLILLLLLFLTLSVPDSADAADGYSLLRPRQYSLTGDLFFDYERQWGDVVEQDKFIHEYHLTLESSIIDRRLIAYELSGYFSQTLQDTADSYHSYGLGTRITLLSKRPLFGFLRFVPQPIELTANYNKSRDTTSYSYGLSLQYSLPLNLVFFREGKFVSLEGRYRPAAAASGTDNGNNNGEETAKARRGLSIPIPSLLVNYNSYTIDNTASDQSQTMDHFNIRATHGAANSRYILEYKYNKSTYDSSSGISTGYKEHRLELRADYFFRDIKSAQTLDIYNRLLYDKFNDLSTLDLSSRGFFLKRLGRDLRDYLRINGQAAYFSSDVTSQYAAGMEASYHRNFSDRLRNTLTGGVAYIEANDSLSMLISDEIAYLLSPKALVTTSVGAFMLSSDQQSYYVSLRLDTRTKIPTTTLYSYSHSKAGSDTTDLHKLEFIFSTPLVGNFYLQSDSKYEINILNGARQNLLSLNNSINGSISSYVLSFGIEYLYGKFSGAAIRGFLADRSVNNNSLTTIYGVLQRKFYKGPYIISRISYRTSNIGESEFEFDQTVAWTFRRVTLYLNYSLNKSEADQGYSTTAHLLTLNLRRSFTF